MESLPVSAVVLAAGASERMGSRNKLLLDFGGKPLIAHVVETILAAGIQNVVVVLGHDAGRVRDILRDHPVTFTVNERFAEGMSTSIHSGVLSAREDAVGYMICLADLPLIKPWELEELVKAFRMAYEADERHIVVPYHKGQRGNPVIFPAIYKEDILAQHGLTGCRGLIKQHGGLVVEIEMETDHVLVDIDTPAAYERLVG